LEDAMREMERIRLEEETERLRKTAAQERELQRLKEQKMREEAEVRQQQLEAKLREEQAARDAAEKQRRIQESAERARAQKAQDEAARRKKEEDERRAREAAAAPPPPVAKPQPVQALQTPSAPAAAAPISTAPSTLSASSAEIIQVHKKYIALHGSMKQFRSQFLAAHKEKTDPLKEAVGDVRRSLRKRMGQVTVELEDSRNTIKLIRAECFDKAINAGGPTIDIRPYLVSHQITNDADAQYPQLLLYAWIIFEKELIKQWYTEASKEDGRIIAQLSLIAASLYLDTRYMCKGTILMIDTLLAKLHRICPMLFGIRGDARTDRAGLGLDKIHPNESDMNRYSQLMTAVGAGYAAITHKKFAQKPPAIPISEYWRAVVSICNTPAESLYPGHFLTLQGLLRDNARKFLITYGVAAKAVLRRATFDLPNRVPEPRAGVKEDRPGLHAAASLVKVLPDVWLKNDKINIR
jgi:nucleoporin GLE1